MAIKTSGPISINDIVNEFGGTEPHNLSEYYRGGARVPDTPPNSDIPTSGSISLSQFYGASLDYDVIIPIPAVDTTTWWNNVVNVNGDKMTTAEPFTLALDFIKNSPNISFSPSVIKIPSFTVEIQGSEDSDDYDDDEYTGIANPGIRIFKPNGDVLGTVRGTGFVFGRQTLTVTVPSAEFTTSQTGIFPIYFIGDLYRSREGDASYLRWTSGAFNIEWSTS